MKFAIVRKCLGFAQLFLRRENTLLMVFPLTAHAAIGPFRELEGVYFSGPAPNGQ